jgi:hypothetical protein
MILNDLQENKFAKLSRALKEVFEVDFNFQAEPAKLQKIKEATDSRLTKLRESGFDSSNKDFQKLLLISESITLALVDVPVLGKATVKESSDLDTAEVLLAAKQMADDLQKMAEDLASMQVEDLMSITNAMKEEIGTAEAEAFNASAEAAIASALEAVKMANDQVSNAVLAAQGQPVETDMDTDMGPEVDAELDMGDDLGDMEAPEDEFGGADAADATVDASGREMKEDAYLAAMRMVKEAQQDGKVSKDLLKQAFARLKG